MSQAMPSKRTAAKPKKAKVQPKKAKAKAANGVSAPAASGPVVTLREKLGLTQQEFATLLGLSTVSVSRWEHKHTKPTDSSKALLALLGRAVERQEKDTIVSALRSLSGADEVDRIITLVHLGD